MCYSFDMALWRSAFAWIPRLRTLEKSGESDWVMSFWQYHLALALQRLKADELRDRSSGDCIPYDGELWILESVARAVLDLPTLEERARLWQPIISTAPHGACWVQNFGATLVSCATSDKQSGLAFLETWPHIIAWMIDSPNWGHSRHANFMLGRAWRTLLGLESANEFLNLCGNHLAAWKVHYSRWAAAWLSDRGCYVMFCRFLGDHRSKVLLPDGLAWLCEKMPAKDLLRYHQEENDAVGELLILLVRTRRKEVLADTVTQHALRSLLSRLSEIHHSRAIEVETLLAGSNGE
jgi:hypothetical protein